jgi:hypothetical protein
MHITKLERAVYELVEAGSIDGAHASLYRRELAALRRAGLVERAEDGRYFITRSSTKGSGTYAVDGSAPQQEQATGTYSESGERRAKALKLVRGR